MLEGFSLCQTHRQPQWCTTTTTTTTSSCSNSSFHADDDCSNDGNDEDDSYEEVVVFDDRLLLRLDVTACEEAFRALTASTSATAWSSSSALAETVVRSARRLIGQRTSCVRAACLALSQLSLRHGRETAKVICEGVGQGLARIAICYAQETNQPAENNATSTTARSLASSQDMCVVWCRLVFALAHTLRGDFFDTLLTTANREYMSARARRLGVDDTSGKETKPIAAAPPATSVSTGLSSLLLSLASTHESSCMATASIAMTTAALLDAATAAVAAAGMDGVASSSPPSYDTGVNEVNRVPVDACDLLSSSCLLSLTDVCVAALKKHASPLPSSPSKWLSSLVQGVAMAIVKADPSSSTAVTAQAALVNANQAAAAAVTYWSALCLYKLLALSHPVAAALATDGSLVTSSSLPADMRSRLLAKVQTKQAKPRPLS